MGNQGKKTAKRLGYVIVLRRISDYGYITAPLYGGRILDLNPGVLTGEYSQEKSVMFQ